MGNSGSFGCFFCLSDTQNQNIKNEIINNINNQKYKLMNCNAIFSSSKGGIGRYTPQPLVCNQSEINDIINLINNEKICIKIFKHFDTSKLIIDQDTLDDNFAHEVHNLSIAHKILGSVFPYKCIGTYWGFKLVFANDSILHEGSNVLPNDRKYWYFVISTKCLPISTIKPNEMTNNILILKNDIDSDLTKLHNAGYIHGDIKPANIVRCGNRHMFIDYGNMQPINDVNIAYQFRATQLYQLPWFNRNFNINTDSPFQKFQLSKYIQLSIHKQVCRYLESQYESNNISINMYILNDRYAVFLVLLTYLDIINLIILSNYINHKPYTHNVDIIKYMIQLIGMNYLTGGAKLTVLYKGKKYIRTIQINKRGTPVVKIDGEFKPLGRLKTI
jgi:hypothetical protein